MKQLIKTNGYGLSVADKDREVYVNSRYVAQVFDKEHHNVLKDIRKLVKQMENVADDTEIGNVKFYASSYVSVQGKKLPCYELNKDAFTLLVMGYDGETALKFKLWYINRFNDMEKQLQTLMELRDDYKDFTDALLELKSNNPYIYSTENDLVYKIATGMTARQWRKTYDVQKGQSIRPYLTKEQLDRVKKVQKYDSVLLEKKFVQQFQLEN